MTDFAWQQFGQIEHGMPRVQAISRWIHDNIEYRYMSGRSDLSASDVLQPEADVTSRSIQKP